MALLAPSAFNIPCSSPLPYRGTPLPLQLRTTFRNGPILGISFLWNLLPSLDAIPECLMSEDPAEHNDDEEEQPSKGADTTAAPAPDAPDESNSVLRACQWALSRSSTAPASCGRGRAALDDGVVPSEATEASSRRGRGTWDQGGGDISSRLYSALMGWVEERSNFYYY